MLTRPEAAEILGKTERWMRLAMARGDLSYVKVGKSVRFTEADIEAFIDKNRRNKNAFR